MLCFSHFNINISELHSTTVDIDEEQQNLMDPGSIYSRKFRKLCSLKNLSRFLIQKNGRTFPEFLNKGALIDLKQSVGRNGSTSSTRK